MRGAIETITVWSLSWRGSRLEMRYDAPCSGIRTLGPAAARRFVDDFRKAPDFLIKPGSSITIRRQTMGPAIQRVLAVDGMTATRRRRHG